MSREKILITVRTYSEPQISEDRVRENAKALAAFSREPLTVKSDALFRTIRKGGKVTIFTVGYEKRKGEDLIHLLIDAGIQTLVDVRQRAMSRKADFRGAALKSRCEDSGISYLAMSNLGSTDALRDELHTSGDLDAFHRKFESYARRNLAEPIENLAEVAKKSTVALLCFERRHEECHRSIIAELAAAHLNATIVAIA